MAEIEITTTGELILEGDKVGQITWARAYAEYEVAGTYDDSGFGFNEFGDPYGCSECDEKEGEIDDLEIERNALLEKVKKLTGALSDLGVNTDELKGAK